MGRPTNGYVRQGEFHATMEGVQRQLAGIERTLSDVRGAQGLAETERLGISDRIDSVRKMSIKIAAGAAAAGSIAGAIASALLK